MPCPPKSRFFKLSRTLVHPRYSRYSLYSNTSTLSPFPIPFHCQSSPKSQFASVHHIFISAWSLNSHSLLPCSFKYWLNLCGGYGCVHLESSCILWHVSWYDCRRLSNRIKVHQKSLNAWYIYWFLKVKMDARAHIQGFQGVDNLPTRKKETLNTTTATALDVEHVKMQ